MFIFRQLFDARSHAFMYLLGDRASGEAVAIDELGHGSDDGGPPGQPAAPVPG